MARRILETRKVEGDKDVKEFRDADLEIALGLTYS